MAAFLLVSCSNKILTSIVVVHGQSQKKDNKNFKQRHFLGFKTIALHKLCFGFALLRFVIGYKILRHFFQPIISKTKTNRDMLGRVFAALGAGCMYLLQTRPVWFVRFVIQSHFRATNCISNSFDYHAGIISCLKHGAKSL